jgi:1,4-alpha-glucan branching enzyme
MAVDIHPDTIRTLVQGDYGAHFEILGVHSANGKNKEVTIRAFFPNAKEVYIQHQDQKKPLRMERLYEGGFFVAEGKGDWSGEKYQYEVHTYEGNTYTTYDPYGFRDPVLTEYDLYLLGEGRHFDSYHKLGANLHEINGVKGVHFAVWAPNAYRVSVVGRFNHWDRRVHGMRLLGNSGVWELFIPGLAEWELYKFDLHSHHMGYRAEKTDPYGLFTEMRPRTASIVVDMSKYQWGDGEWMQGRAERGTASILKAPMNIYEVHLGSWRRKGNHEWLNYHELADQLVKYLKAMNYTHVELMPVSEHPFDGSWGYQVTGYFAVTSRFGTPQDFMYFVDQCHQNGIGVIVDWVPAHFPKDGSALSYFDGTHLYEHSDPRQGEHPDWGTYIFNFGRNEVRNFLIASALFWLKEYHIDGLRVDAVSSMLYLDFGRKDGEWIPNEYGGNQNLEAMRFLQEANTVIHTECPGTFTVAEESTSWGLVSRPTYVGGLGFTFKWNMGWMHDSLLYMSKDPVHRRFHHHNMTFSLMYAWSENFVLSISHDEVVHLKGSLIHKMPGDWWQKMANVRAYLGFQAAHPGKKLMFMGQEFGQWREWSEERSLDWHLVEQFEPHAKLQAWVRDLNQFYLSQPALWEHDFDPSGFEWIEANDADNSIFSFLRYADNRDDFLVVVCNFTPVPREGYRVGVPLSGFYKELINSDSEFYGGGNVGNNGGVWAERQEWHGRPTSIRITVPPLGIVMFKRYDIPN